MATHSESRAIAKVSYGFLASCLSFTLILISSLPASAQHRKAAGGLYHHLFAGATILPELETDFTETSADVSSEVGFNVGGGIGFRIPLDKLNLRLEGEFSYRRNKFDAFNTPDQKIELSGNIRTLAVLLNLYLDLHVSRSFTAWIGAGGGYANIEFEDISNNSITVPAYQAMFGIDYDTGGDDIIYIGYNFLATDDYDLRFGPNDFSTEYKSHNLKIGYKINF